MLHDINFPGEQKKDLKKHVSLGFGVTSDMLFVQGRDLFPFAASNIGLKKLFKPKKKKKKHKK